MNRMGLGLAIGAGYFLGRTKKLKMALAVGSLVAGKKLNLTPRGMADLLSQQLRDNPQFKELGDQLRQDLRGVGKAASGAMVERQMSALADRLSSRTSQVRDQLSGTVSGSGADDDEEQHADDADEDGGRAEDSAGQDAPSRDRVEDDGATDDGGARQDGPPRRKVARKAPPKDAPAEKAAQAGAPAKKAAAKKTGAARKTAAKKTTAAGGARARLPKGGDDR